MVGDVPPRIRSVPYTNFFKDIPNLISVFQKNAPNLIPSFEKVYLTLHFIKILKIGIIPYTKIIKSQYCSLTNIWKIQNFSVGTLYPKHMYCILRDCLSTVAQMFCKVQKSVIPTCISLEMHSSLLLLLISC